MTKNRHNEVSKKLLSLGIRFVEDYDDNEFKAFGLNTISLSKNRENEIFECKSFEDIILTFFKTLTLFAEPSTLKPLLSNFTVKHNTIFLLLNVSELSSLLKRDVSFDSPFKFSSPNKTNHTVISDLCFYENGFRNFIENEAFQFTQQDVIEYLKIDTSPVSFFIKDLIGFYLDIQKMYEFLLPRLNNEHRPIGKINKQQFSYRKIFKLSSEIKHIKLIAQDEEWFYYTVENDWILMYIINKNKYGFLENI